MEQRAFGRYGSQDKPLIVVYVLVVPEGYQLTLNAPRDTVSKEIFRGGAHSPVAIQESNQVIDSWLPAPEHQGVSESTLYRYAEHRTIESRKLSGKETKHAVAN